MLYFIPPPERISNRQCPSCINRKNKNDKGDDPYQEGNEGARRAGTEINRFMFLCNRGNGFGTARIRNYLNVFQMQSPFPAYLFDNDARSNSDPVFSTPPNPL
jgi:hypothetical protein